MVKNTKHSTQWRNEIQELLRHRSATITLKAIAEVTGLGEQWLKLIHQGKITDPSINKMETLHNYLISIKH